jgi:hypothetical protein
MENLLPRGFQTALLASHSSKLAVIPPANKAKEASSVDAGIGAIRPFTAAGRDYLPIPRTVERMN